MFCYQCEQVAKGGACTIGGTCGEINLKTMELLDAANTGTYGHPVPTKVTLGAKRARRYSFQAMTSRTWRTS